jgi:2-hydroxy-3-oxopropionate reductase
VLDGAEKLNISLPGTSGCQQLFNAALASGEGELDDSAMALVLERLALHAIAK